LACLTERVGDIIWLAKMLLILAGEPADKKQPLTACVSISWGHTCTGTPVQLMLVGFREGGVPALVGGAAHSAGECNNLCVFNSSVNALHSAQVACCKVNVFLWLLPCDYHMLHGYMFMCKYLRARLPWLDQLTQTYVTDRLRLKLFV
jgi:hypothetical protein